MAALQRYATRNHAAEYANWQATIDAIYDGIRDLPELRITRCSHGQNGQPWPNLQIESGAVPCRQDREMQDVAEVVRLPAPQGLSVRSLLLALRNLPRKIVLAEDEQSPDRAVLYSQCLQPGDAEEIISAIRQAVSSHRERLTR
jgi:L-seryl-tRNA(Ser) seleniumtransferase